MDNGTPKNFPLDLPPENDALPNIGPRKSVAGGPPAVTSAMAIGLKEMGVVTTAKTLMAVNQVKGFDCPGCAWPDPEDHRSIAEFCENGAKAVAEEATLKRVTPDFFKAHSVSFLAGQTEYWLSQQGRITHPMLLREGGTHYEPCSWDEAFSLIARELNATNPDRTAFYTSGRTSNEAAFLYQLFVRQYGTNNFPDCSHLCHQSSGVALKETIGSGKGTVHLRDFDLADAIFVVGQNPGTNHPRMLSTLQKAARRGCKIVAINPLREAGLERFKHPQEIKGWIGRGTSLATHYLQVKINGDVAVFKGIMKEMLARQDSHGDAFDSAFIREHTDGFESFCQALRDETWENILGSSGVTREEIRAVAQVAMSSKNIICCWAMGLTQHKNAVATIQEIVNFLLLGGHIGRPGAGACPVRGHSNVQGDRTMGIWEAPSATFLNSLAAEFGFEPPRKPGYHVVSAIQAMHSGLIDVFFALGGNFLSASPDTGFTGQALRRCRLTVQVSTKLNRSHFVPGRMSLILPCLGRTERDVQDGEEQFVTVEDSMGVIHASRGVLNPASLECKSEVAIIAELAAKTLGSRSTVKWSQLSHRYDLIREHIERVIPGFERFNVRVREPFGFCLPHLARDSRTFDTATGKARFTLHDIPESEAGPGQYILMTIRSHDQYNTTIYGLGDRYRGVSAGRRVLFMNAEDMEREGYGDGDLVDIFSHFRDEVRQVARFRVVPYDIPLGCLASYFPETNPLVPIGSFADKSFTPTSKSIVVTLKHHQAPV